MSTLRKEFFHPVSYETYKQDPTTGLKYDVVRHTHYGIPMRLEIASRLLAGYVASPSAADMSDEDICKTMFRLTDLLIQTHYETCEEKGE